MLTSDERLLIAQVLSNWIPSAPLPRQSIVSAIGNNNFASFLPEAEPLTLINATLDLCMRDAWNNLPPWLHNLFINLNLTLLDPRLLPVWERIQIPPVPVANQLQATVLNDVTPFVNRTAFRKRLGTLATAAGMQRPILVIEGQPKSGKSYSNVFIDHFALTQTASQVTYYPYRFDPDQASITGPDEVADDLVGRMGLADIPKPEPVTNKVLHAQQLARWVMNQAVRAGGQHWFVLDNFQGDGLRDDTRHFVNMMAALLVGGGLPSRCRLILIDYDRTKLTVDEGKVDAEAVLPCTPADIQQAITDILTRTPTVTLPAVLPFVTTNLPTNTTQMSELNRRLRLLLKAVNGLTVLLANRTDITYEPVLLKLLANLPADRVAATQELEQRLAACQASLQTT